MTKLVVRHADGEIQCRDFSLYVAVREMLASGVECEGVEVHVGGLTALTVALERGSLAMLSRGEAVRGFAEAYETPGRFPVDLWIEEPNPEA